MRKTLILAAILAGAVLAPVMAPVAALSAPKGLTEPAPMGLLFQASQHFCFDKADQPEAILKLAESEGWTPVEGRQTLSPGQTYMHLRSQQKEGRRSMLMLSDRPFETDGMTFPISLCTVAMDRGAGASARDDVARWLGFASPDEHGGLAVWVVQPTATGFAAVAEDGPAMQAALKKGPVLTIAVKSDEEPVMIFYGAVKPPKN